MGNCEHCFDNSCFIIWAFIRDYVYHIGIRNLPHVKESIQEATLLVSRDMIPYNMCGKELDVNWTRAEALKLRT